MRVIKAGSGVEVSGYAPGMDLWPEALDQSASPADDLVERLMAENLVLQQKVEVLEMERLDLAARMQADQKAAEARAYDQGLALGQGKAHETLQSLASHLLGLKAHIEVDIERIERLALLVSTDCLEQVFGDGESWIERTAQAISHQLKSLEQQAGLSVRVSASEFAQDEDFHVLCAALSGAGAIPERSSSLKAGEAEIELELGRLEVGAGQQWTRLKTALAEAYDLRVAS